MRLKVHGINDDGDLLSASTPSLHAAHEDVSLPAIVFTVLYDTR